MKFLALNKKRHAAKQFNNEPVDIKDLRTAIEIATLAPSAHNMQPWKFVIVKDKKAELVEVMFGKNREQGDQAQYLIALFSDTDLPKRTRKIARLGSKNLSDEQLSRFLQAYPKLFEQFKESQKDRYLSLNIGLVTMNLVLALTDQGLASNIFLGFDDTKVNSILDIDERFRPEVLISVGYSDEQIEPSYRLPVDEVIEVR